MKRNYLIDTKYIILPSIIRLMKLVLKDKIHVKLFCQTSVDVQIDHCWRPQPFKMQNVSLNSCTKPYSNLVHAAS